MDKVKITQEQADALDEMFKQGINNRVNIINAHYRDSNGWIDHCTPLNGMDTDELIQAVYIGYEIEETPEDKVRKYYHSLKRDEDWEPDEYQRACGVIMTLDLLGIKIEGVNS